MVSAQIYTVGVESSQELLEALRRYWGYAAFRPMQERIVRSLLAGRDACVVMPTGGGKSLCYQLPAALTPAKTAVVISPLIALMQDQVTQLTQMGLPAAFLNSTLPQSQQTKIMRDADAGRYRLLYLSPERLARDDTAAWLGRVPVSFFAIDEAHCISEWGHEFRPEYRQLSRLRQKFPDAPIAAFTASATRRVRHDIMEQLQLRAPEKFIASFHRPNLRYVVRECDGQSQPGLLVQAMKQYAGSNVIVYAPTIARVEETVDFLEERGLSAVPYHGQMDAGTRRRNQERWMSDEVRVLVGTIAFGLGINKPSVRAVVHLSLPKSVEQYYQEAGRAGRDGLPSDCLLLWQKRDAGLLTYFIKQLTDRAETERAWKRYHEIRDFVDASACRHRQICLHFGETPKWKTCGACDACGYTLEWLVAEEPKRRRKRKSAAPVATKAARPTARGGVGRESMFEPPEPRRATDEHADLREYLREWRRTVAQEQNVPAYVVLHDSSLDDLCVKQPRTLDELLGVFGFGERKTEQYGPQLLAALEQFRKGVRATVREPSGTRPAAETMRLLAEGRTFDEIAAVRGRRRSTIISLVADLVERGELAFQPAWVEASTRARIEAACARLGFEPLRPLKDALPPEITYDDIRLVAAHLRRKHQAAGEQGKAE